MRIKNIVSYCGLTCSTCLIYCAGREDDEEVKKKLRSKIAQISNENYGTNYTEKDITDCEGCRSESGKLFPACTNCIVRACARSRNFQTCAHCNEYPCIHLKAVFSADPSAKTWLDVIRSII